MNRTIRVLLVDDHAIVRSGFRRLLEEYPNIAVVAEADSGETAYRGFVEHQPDVLVLDISMPDTSGLALLGRVLGRDPGAFTDDASLLEEGLDSLRVMDLLGALRKRIAVELSPAELMARPTLGSFAPFVAERLSALAPAATSPLVTLQAGGEGTPIFFLHPSGGEVTPYLRLRALLGDARPLYAIQSRAGGAPEREHATLLAMAADYADVVQGVRPHGPYALVGWSMGGVIAHAVAVELERRGEAVALVGAIDSPARAEVATELAQLGLALSGIVYDLAPSPPEGLDRTLRELYTSRVPREQLHAWCVEHGLLARDAASPERFDAMMQLRFHHFRITGEHARGVVRAPMIAWWAERPIGDWSAFAPSLTEHTLGGTHFTVVRPPLLDQIASALRAALAGH